MKKDQELMYITGIMLSRLSDCQELLGLELNDEENEGWVTPDNAQHAIAIMNEVKELLFNKMVVA